MELTHHLSCQSLFTAIADELVTFAEFLVIPTDINMQDDHGVSSGD